MPDPRGYGICPFCHKERPLYRHGTLKPHNAWNGIKMVPCLGGLQKPAQPGRSK